MKLTKTEYNNTTARINYLLAKYSLKLKQESKQNVNLPEPDSSYYLDEDPNFLPFYAKV